MNIFTWLRDRRTRHRPCRCADCVAWYGWPPILPSALPPPPANLVRSYEIVREAERRFKLNREGFAGTPEHVQPKGGVS
jgi:hypothetical protein